MSSSAPAAAQCPRRFPRQRDACQQADPWWLSLVATTRLLLLDTARLFQSGRSQAVRLPKDYRFSGCEVVVKHFGNGVLLLPMDDPWQTMEAGLAAFEPGFKLRREQPDQQLRDVIQPDVGAQA